MILPPPSRRLAEHGLRAWEQVLERGYEGLVAKDARTAYRPGPTTSWRKVTLEVSRLRSRDSLWATRG